MNQSETMKRIEVDEHLTLTYASYPNSGLIVVFLQGRIDTDNSQSTIDHLTELLRVNDTMNRLILDLSGVVYASSTGIGVLTTMLTRSREANTQFKLANVGGHIKSVLDLLGFSPFFEFIPDQSEHEEPPKRLW